MKPQSIYETRSRLNFPLQKTVYTDKGMPIYDQGILGSSTACAYCSVINYRKMNKYANDTFKESRMYVYTHE